MHQGSEFGSVQQYEPARGLKPGQPAREQQGRILRIFQFAELLRMYLWHLRQVMQSDGRSCQTGIVPESRTDKLRKLIQDVAGKPAPADEDESLFESGLLDSFALPDLVSAIEHAFSIKVPDADLNPRKFDSIARIEAYLDSK